MTTNETKPSAPTAGRMAFPRLAAWLAAGLAGFVALVLAALLLVLNTQVGRNALAGLIENLAASEDFRLELHGLDSAMPWDVRLSSFALADAQGVWLAGHDLRVGLDLWATLANRPTVTHLTLERLSLARLPKASSQAEAQAVQEPASLSFDIPDFSWPHVGLLRVAAIEIADGLLTEAEEGSSARVYTLSGESLPLRDSIAVRLDLDELSEGAANGETDSLSVRIDWHRADDVLHVDVRLDAGPDGLLGPALAEATGADVDSLRARLAGTGPLNDWGGILTLDANDLSLLHADLSLRRGAGARPGVETLQIGLAAVLADVLGLVPDDAADLLGREAEVLARLVVPLGSRAADEVRLEALDVALAALCLHANGILARGKLTAEAAIEALDPALLGRFTGGVLDGSPRLDLALRGGEDELFARLEADLGSLVLPDLTGSLVRLAADIDARSPLDAPTRTVRAKGRADVGGLTPPPGTVLDESLRIDFDASLQGEDRLRLDAFSLVSGENTLFASGSLDLAEMLLSAIAKAALPNAGTLFGLRPVKAALNLSATAHGDLDEGIRIEADIDASGIQGLDPALAALIGEHAVLLLEAEFDDDALTLHGLDLTSRTTLHARGRLGLADDTLRTTARLTLPDDPAFVEQALGIRPSGLSPIDITVEGVLGQRLDISLAAQAKSLEMAGQRLTSPALRLASGISLAPDPAPERLALSLAAQEIELRAQAAYILDNDHLRLPELAIETPGARLDGELALALATGLLRGRLQLDAPRLDALAPLLGLDLSGGLQARLDLADGASAQAVNLTATGRSLVLDEMSLASLSLEATSTDLHALVAERGAARLDLRAAGLGMEGFSAETVNLATTVSGPDATLDLSARGASDGKPFTLALTAKLQPFAETFAAELSSLAANYAGLPVRSLAPARIEADASGLRLQGLALDVGGGELRAQGEYGPRAADFGATLRGFPLRALPALDLTVPSGLVDLDLDVQGPVAAPRATIRLEATGITAPPDQGLIDLPPVALSATALAADGRLAAQAEVRHETARLVSLDASLPLAFALEPFAFSMDQGAPITATATGALDLGLLRDLPALSDQILSGALAFDLAARGSLDDPLLEGDLSLSEGRYENLRFGSVLRDIQMAANARGRMFTLTRLSARDGANGRIEGDGSLTLAEGDGPMPFAVRLGFDRFEPVNNEIMRGTVSGDLNLAGDSVEGAKLAGRLTVDRAEVDLPRGLPPDVVDIDVTYVDERGDEAETPQARERAKPLPLTLDIGVTLPPRIRVRGHGLDSVWRGNLDITGTAEEPRIIGGLQVERGTFDFLDRVFRIDEGLIQFSGATPPTPDLRVVATTNAAAILAKVILAGTPQNLKITLDSDPAVPENEILAAVLFGRSLDSLTPMQALRLARAVDQLARGGSSGPDITRTIARGVGLDDLSTGEGAATGGTTVQAGKYVTDNVYLKGGKGLDPRDDTVGVEIEISPQLGLESQMGRESQGGIGLNWRYDY